VGEPAPIAVSLDAVGRRFVTPTGAVDALAGVGGEILAGSVTVIAGPSGSGKSTLLGLIACLDRPTAGAVRLDGTDVGGESRRWRRRLRQDAIGVVLPIPHENLLLTRSATQNVEWSARMRGRPTLAEDDLEAAGLGGRLHSAARHLSGGEQLRVAVVCAFAGSPRLVVADEPTASLDAESSATVAALLTTMARGSDGGGPVTVVVTTHDPAVIAVADDVIRLDHGRRL
jgi:putative ABC transport system ATP-binding protein